MALKKRGKFWHYEFMIDGRKYRGTTKEKGKVRAAAVEASLMTSVRTTVGGVNFKKAPVLRDFSTRFLKFVDAETEAGQLDPDTKSTITMDGSCWTKQRWRICGSIGLERATPQSSAFLTVLHTPTRLFAL
jgi:hypothetical protein